MREVTVERNGVKYVFLLAEDEVLTPEEIDQLIADAEVARNHE